MISLLKDGQIAERWRVEDAKKYRHQWIYYLVSLASKGGESRKRKKCFEKRLIRIFTLGHSRPPIFSLLSSFNTIFYSADRIFLHMTGIEPRIAGVRSTLVPGKDLYEISLNFGISWVNFAAHLRSLRFALRQSNHTQNNSNGCRYIIFLLLKIST